MASTEPNVWRRTGVVAGALVATVAVSEVMGAIGLRDRGYHGLPVPLPVMLLALASGCFTALFAVGIVLIYRSARIINFAHGGFGAVAAALYYELQVHERLPFPIAVAAGIGAGLGLGLVVELFFVRRFTSSSRLVLTVVTLAVGELLVGIAASVPDMLNDVRPVTSVPRTPVSRFSWHVRPVVISGAQMTLFLVTAAILVGAVAFFRYSDLGIAIRGAAENSDRVALLGVKVSVLAPFLWATVALLSSVGAILAVMSAGYTPGAVAATAVASPLLIRALAAAVIADMESLPVAVAASLGLAVFEQSTFFAFSQSSLADAAALAVIVVFLLLRRRRLARSDEGAVGTWAATEEIRPVPRELNALPSVRAGVQRFIGAGVLLLLLVPWAFSPPQIVTASLFMVYGIVVTSIVVLTGWGGQISLGQFGFVAIGALAGGWMVGIHHLPFFLGLLFGTLLGAVVAVLVGLPALRIRGLFLAVTTLSFALVTRSLLLNPKYFGGFIARRITRPDVLWLHFEDERTYYYFCLLSLGGAVYVATRLRRSRVGRVLIAMRDNERTAQSYGINLVRTRLTTFAVSGALAAFAGVVLAGLQHAVIPDSYGSELSVQLFLMTIIGGLGSVTGALAGAAYFGTLNLVTVSPIFRLLGSAVGALLVLLFFPAGIGGFFYSLRDSVLRRVAIRRRIYVPSLLGAFGVVGEHMGRAPLAPLLDNDGKAIQVEPVYARPSRIGVAGESQAGRRWQF